MNANLSADKYTPQTSIYELAGGSETFHRLAAKFYAGVESEPAIRPMYPDDLSESARWLGLFLIQFCGGPADYSLKKGHPRLRMRHLPWSIGPVERDAWLRQMNAATESEIENSDVKAFLLAYFERTANFMMNADVVPSGE